MITRYKDVVDVLARAREFSVVPTNGRKMAALNADFFLGMDQGAVYDKERAWLDAAVERSDGPRLVGEVDGCRSRSTSRTAARSSSRSARRP